MWLLYAVALSSIAFWPSPVDRDFSGILSQLIEEINQQLGYPMFSYDFVEFVANIFLFIPLGILVSSTSKQINALLLLAASVAGILSIEFVQKVILEQRFASALDVLANCLGLFIGFWLTRLFEKIHRKNSAKTLGAVTVPL